MPGTDGRAVIAAETRSPISRHRRDDAVAKLVLYGSGLGAAQLTSACARRSPFTLTKAPLHVESAFTSSAILSWFKREASPGYLGGRLLRVETERPMGSIMMRVAALFSTSQPERPLAGIDRAHPAYSPGS